MAEALLGVDYLWVGSFSSSSEICLISKSRHCQLEAERITSLRRQDVTLNLSCFQPAVASNGSCWKQGSVLDFSLEPASGRWECCLY